MSSDPDSRTEPLARLLRQANAGDASAYRMFLHELAPVVRAMARRHVVRIGTPVADIEDAVQETLLAIHLKRHTWMASEPIGPWISAIVRYKLIDLARKHGRRQEVEFDEHFDLAAPEPDEPPVSEQQMERLLNSISATQGTVVRSVSIKGMSIREVAAIMNMSEGTVRVTLHRGLKAIAKAYQALST